MCSTTTSNTTLTTWPVDDGCDEVLSSGLQRGSVLAPGLQPGASLASGLQSCSLRVLLGGWLGELGLGVLLGGPRGGRRG